MDYERRLEAYEYLGALDPRAKSRLQLLAFLDKHPYLRDALRSYAKGHACNGEEEVTQEATYIAQALKASLVKEGLRDATEEEFLEAALEYKKEREGTT